MTLLLLGCANGSTTLPDSASVASIKADPEAWAGRVLRLEAYLVSTRHGEYFADSRNDKNVLIASFSESPEHRKATTALLEKLGRANLGTPHAEIHGSFEGRLIVTSDGKRVSFEIYSEVAPN